MRTAFVVVTIVLGLVVAGCSVGSETDAAARRTAPPSAQTAGPDTRRPDANSPDTRRPDATDPEARRPDTSGIDAANPDATNPDTTDPDATNPDPASPDDAPSPPPTSDVVYMTMNGIDLTMDVYTPAGSGPWPIVVEFHGLSSARENAETTTIVAEAAAAQGLLVFAPAWIAGDPFPITIDDIEMLRETGNCAVAFAQQYANQYGGDAARTVVSGFSAGTGPALASVLSASSGPVAGCAANTAPTPIIGALLGDGEYFWQSENFDDAFRDDLADMQAAVALFTSPPASPDDVSTTFFLWAAAEGTAPRALGVEGGDAEWLALRDPDGSIRADLLRLGSLDDEVVDYVDSARLLELRLRSAGLDVTLEEYPGGHTTLDKAPTLADLLTTLASRG